MHFSCKISKKDLIQSSDQFFSRDFMGLYSNSTAKSHWHRWNEQMSHSSGLLIASKLLNLFASSIINSQSFPCCLFHVLKYFIKKILLGWMRCCIGTLWERLCVHVITRVTRDVPHQGIRAAYECFVNENAHCAILSSPCLVCIRRAHLRREDIGSWVEVRSR